MNKTAYHNQLNSQLFDYLPLTSDVLAQSVYITFNNNEMIQQEAVPMTYFYLLLTGKAKIIKDQANGKRALLHFLHPGDSIGDLTLVGAETEPKTVIALGKTSCIGIPIQLAKQELMQNPLFVQALAKEIGEKLLLRMDSYMLQQTYPLDLRLALLLLETAVDDHYQEKMTETAEFLGVSYRHLTFTLKRFKEQGLVEKQAYGYHINAKVLQDYVNQKHKGSSA